MHSKPHTTSFADYVFSPIGKLRAISHTDILLEVIEVSHSQWDGSQLSLKLPQGSSTDW